MANSLSDKSITWSVSVSFYYSAELCVLSILSALTSHSAHGIHYNYTTKTNQMHNFIIWYLISYVSHMFRNSWIHPKEDSYILSMVCFACIGVSSLVGRSVCNVQDSSLSCMSLVCVVQLYRNAQCKKHTTSILRFKWSKLQSVIETV
jgi:hypothetical protein